MKHGFRFWMSGCAAVISLALAGFVDSPTDDGDADPKAGLMQLSRFDMAQTLQRLEACAPQHGLTVIACWSPRGGGSEPAAGSLSRAGQATQSVLVFATQEGGTPVLMTDESAVPDLPLSLRLRQRADGRVEVQVPQVESAFAHELPSKLIRELTELPGLVADALA